MQATASWFRSDPRRLCVVGVWFSLLGLAVTVGALLAGDSLLGLLAGAFLSATGSWAKVAGRDLFRRNRAARLRASFGSRARTQHLPISPAG